MIFLIKPSWEIFKAKFNENPQENFEWFCYSLFCVEFKKETGIFRYKNQSGIETNPIQINEDIIGWQSKFYETTLSDHKADLISTIDKSKKNYPSITRLIFYTNQEWGQGRAKETNDPQAKIEVERKAKLEGIEVEWRTASFFESPFVTMQNKSISEHFFSLDRSFFEVMKERENRSKVFLDEIKNEISFSDKKIEINRNEILEELSGKASNEQIIFIAGNGGVGKTAIIKEYYSKNADDFPIYFFKANEFEISTPNLLFGKYTLQNFVQAHSNDSKKMIIVDSSERLLDLKNNNAFKEFFYFLRQDGWKFIFTARSNFLNDINMYFIEQYEANPTTFHIPDLNESEVRVLSEEYQFELPTDKKLLNLLKNLFYLNEYLKLCTNGAKVDFKGFKDNLWNRVVKKTNIIRERLFIKIALQRVETGYFFVQIEENLEVANELVADGLLGYETNGYFIAHDIYEEWALEKNISMHFIQKQDFEDFFSRIGENLPTRRIFRKWLLYKLSIKDIEIESFIEEVMEDERILSFWIDEIVVSILLSDESEKYFSLLERKIIEDNFSLMKRMLFLIRIACTEVDEKKLKSLDKLPINLHLDFIFTKPIGSGWEALIKFISKHSHSFGNEDLNTILPIMIEWTKNNSRGDTTNLCANFALQNYENLNSSSDRHYKYKELQEELITIILNGSLEIKDILSHIIEQVISNKWKKRRDPYYTLVNRVAYKPLENNIVYAAVPREILRLLKFLWLPIEDELFHRRAHYRNRLGVEEYFGFEDVLHHEYAPASALQTPIYWLLIFSERETVDFILELINFSAEKYFESELDENFKHIIQFKIGKGTTQQIASNRLWNSYRGNQVSTDVFASIHMALEKYLLDIAKDRNPKILEAMLIYILTNAKSVSLTSVVTSVVMANTSKTFEISCILFRNKEFYFFEKNRKLNESNLGFGFMSFKPDGRIHENDRKESAKYPHRNKDLEYLALWYQFFKESELITDAEVTIRQETIWKIFDEYYEELMEVDDKTWRLYLARMDRRKMNPIIEKSENEDGLIIDFNPEISPDLEKYSSASKRKNEEKFEFIGLSNWARKKHEGSNQNEEKKYEHNPLQALKEVKIILEKLEIGDSDFGLINKSTPSIVCSVLVKFYSDLLPSEDLEFCKNLLLEYACLTLNHDYFFQIGDGVEQAVSVLPLLLKQFPKDQEMIKTMLFLMLLNSKFIDNQRKFSDLSADTIRNLLWEVDIQTAESLIIGYILLKPIYDLSFHPSISEENIHRVSKTNKNQLLEKFITENEEIIEKIINSTISLETEFDFKKLDLNTSATIFRMINIEFRNKWNQKILLDILSNWIPQIIRNERDSSDLYLDILYFKQRYVEIVMSIPDEDVEKYLDLFLTNFGCYENVAEILQEFILSEITLNTNERFWYVWDKIYKHIVQLNILEADIYFDEIITSYLFSRTPWVEERTEWSSFTTARRYFFRNVAKDMGANRNVLYSFALIFDTVGQIYMVDGVKWIASMLKNNKKLRSSESIHNTVYHLEGMMKKIIFNHRESIRREPQKKNDVLIILDFLISKGSVAGYLLRENIL